ncbi:MAG TPA: ABC transporter substrate-binding protein [Verrucomicrobiae bacterium]|jgi:sulfonate transport system substrate-binding protein|nr:ABC transporter substrate-binding protein [Verrucomicrobiae bacterium]
MIAWLVLLQTSLTIAVGGPITSPEYVPLHLAQAEGHFAAQQLAVTLRPMRSDAGAAEALALGHTQLAATSLDAALRLGHVEGAPPRLVWGLTAAAPVALLVNPARAESIRSAADLLGQTVAVPAPGTTEDQTLGLLLARAGVPVSRVTLRSLGERGAARALESGEVAAAVLAEPYVSRLVGDGKAAVAIDLRTAAGAAAALGGPTVNAALFARAGAGPDAATLRALGAALQAALARVTGSEPDALATALPPAVVGSPADFATRLRSARDLFLPGGRVSVETLAHSLALVRARAPLPIQVKVPKRVEQLLAEPPSD